MRLPATLSRHRIFAVFAALAMWLAQPALAALCPCLSIASTTSEITLTAVEQNCESPCCERCRPPADQIQPILTSPAASCPAFDVGLAHQAATLTGDSLAKVSNVGPSLDSGEASDLALDFASADFSGPGATPLGFGQPRTLALLVARRCHPCHAPPVS